EGAAGRRFRRRRAVPGARRCRRGRARPSRCPAAPAGRAPAPPRRAPMRIPPRKSRTGAPQDEPVGPLRSPYRRAEACLVGILGLPAIAWSLVPLVGMTVATAVAPHLRDRE